MPNTTTVPTYTAEQEAAALAYREARLRANQAAISYRNAGWAGLPAATERARAAKKEADAEFAAAAERFTRLPLQTGRILRKEPEVSTTTLKRCNLGWPDWVSRATDVQLQAQRDSLLRHMDANRHQGLPDDPAALEALDAINSEIFRREPADIDPALYGLPQDSEIGPEFYPEPEELASPAGWDVAETSVPPLPVNTEHFPGSCPTWRVKLITKWTGNLLTGETTFKGRETRIERCNIPLFDGAQVCRSCARGWEVAGNRYATPTEIEHAERSEREARP